MSNDLLRGMGKSSLARLIVLPVTGVAGGISTYLVIDYAGVSVYGYIALVGAMFQLVPFADLGLGAAVINAVAQKVSGAESDDVHARRTVRAATIALSLSALGLLVIVAAISVTGSWTRLLGLSNNAVESLNLAVFLAIAPFAISLPLGVGQRILLGLSRNPTMNLISGLGPVVALGTTALMIRLGANPVFLSVATPLGVLCVALATFRVAMHSADWNVRSVFARNDVDSETRPVQLWNTAMPYFLVVLAVPLGLQSGRIVLAHLGNADQLAQFSVAFQFYAPALSLSTTAAVTLWPIFARDRAASGDLWRQSLRIMSLVGLGLGTGFALLIRFIGHLVTHGEVTIPWGTAVAFGILLFVFSVHQPSGVLLTSPRLMVFQAICSIAMVLISLSLSVLLAPDYGASGVATAMSAGVLLGLVVPGLFRARSLVGEKIEI